jgi:bacterioferritin-associated ferredoxin
MATTLTPPAVTPTPAAAPCAAPLLGPPMTRCECAGVTFEEVARRIAAERLSADQAVLRTGCGQTCTACVPDLLRFLATR